MNWPLITFILLVPWSPNLPTRGYSVSGDSNTIKFVSDEALTVSKNVVPVQIRDHENRFFWRVSSGYACKSYGTIVYCTR